MKKMKWHKVLGLMLTVALTVTSLPQGMSTVRAEETVQTNTTVSQGDVTEETTDVADTVEVEEQVEPEVVLPQLAEPKAEDSPLESTVLEVYNATPDLVIKNTAGLIAFSDEVRSGNTYAGKTVKLGANITFDGLTIDNFTPIGSDYSAFQGTFDGAGYTISGLVVISNNSNYCGLFRNIGSSGVVKNLTLSNSEFNVSGATYVGGIAGYSSGSIYNCVVTNSKVVNINDSFAGGIAGYHEGVINMCRVLNGSVECTYLTVGGIAGYSSYGEIMNCLNTATISGGYYSGHYSGGICGSAYNTAITNCANMGTVSRNGYYVGGIAGLAYGASKIQNCYNVGELKRTDNSSSVYGLVAYCEDTTVVANCYYSNTVLYGVDAYDSVVTRNNAAMALEDMKKTAFADRLNTNSAANPDWVPWEIRAGLAYPQHVPVYTISAEDTSYGTVSVDRGHAYKGLTVNITVTPDTYYAVSSVTVKTASGTAVAVSGSNGSYKFTMPAGNVTVDVNFKYSKPITECAVTPNKTSYTYDGSAKKPTVTVKDGLKTLVSGTDYTLTYSNNVNAGTGKITVKGKGNYTGTKAVTFSITQASQGLSVSKSSYTKTYGNSSFSLGAKTKKGPGKFTYSSSDSSVASVNSKGAVTIKGTGYAKITVTATGNTNYKKESKAVTLIVKPKKQKLSSVKLISDRGLKITWSKDKGAEGYRVEYSTDKKNWSYKVVYGSATNSTAVTGLTQGKVYYIRVCSYVYANGTTYLGEYSPVMKSEKIKPFMEDTYITLSKTSYEYDGKSKKPSVKITYNGKKLKNGRDYALSYSNNVKVGSAKVTITGKGNYTGKVTRTFMINKITPTFSGNTYYSKKHGDKAFNLNIKLKKGRGFTKLVYKSSNNNVATVNKTGKVTVKGPGKAVITVIAEGNQYCNKATQQIDITVSPKQAKITSLKGKKYGVLTAKWNKVEKASGYEVQYSTYSNFYSYNYTTIYSGGTTNVTLYLNDYQKYYVRVRAYKEVDTYWGTERIYGPYSTVKSVRTK